ncbi:MAG: restriction endonuclease subunit S [Prevotella melaninogenica]
MNIVLKPRKTLYPDFCNYLLKSEAFINEYYRNGRGIVADLWTTRYQEMKMIKVAIPKMDEQIAITHYLDSATSNLDRAISQQQNMIDLLNERKQIIIQNAVTKGLDSNVKMKDSGIDWIGEIPIYWETRRLDFCAWIRARLGWKGLKASEYTDTGYPFLSAFNIVNKQLCWEPINFINRQRYEESPDIKLKIGDILLVKDGAGIGKCARVDLLPLGESTANGSLAFITPNKDVNYKYLYYFIISDSFKQLTSILINGMGVPHLTQGEMKKVKIPLPPINEQNRIAVCLDNKIGKLNKAINSVQVLIEKMQERKQIIINDVVTGKVKVS